MALDCSPEPDLEPFSNSTLVSKKQMFWPHFIKIGPKMWLLEGSHVFTIYIQRKLPHPLFFHWSGPFSNLSKISTRAVCKTCMPPIWAVSCSGSHCVNTFFVTVGVICQSWSMYLWSFMIIGLSILELSSGNHLTVLSHYDLNLWPSDLKINRGHLPVIINVPMKFHGPRRKHSWVIILKPFYCFE